MQGAYGFMAKKASENPEHEKIRRPSENQRLQDCVDSLARLHQLQGTLISQLRQAISKE